MKKYILISSFSLIISLLSASLMAYSFTINNKSSYSIGVMNGATGYDSIVQPHAKKTFSLSDGNPFQIYYKYLWHSIPTTDYLAGIARDGNVKSISITLQQPAQNPTWYAHDVTISGRNYGSAELRHWPDAPSLSGCDNRNWGTICSNSGDSASVTFSN